MRRTLHPYPLMMPTDASGDLGPGSTTGASCIRVENNVITEFQRTKTTRSVVQQGKIRRKSDLRSLLQMAGVLGDYASG